MLSSLCHNTDPSVGFFLDFSYHFSITQKCVKHLGFSIDVYYNDLELLFQDNKVSNCVRMRSTACDRTSLRVGVKKKKVMEGKLTLGIIFLIFTYLFTFI